MPKPVPQPGEDKQDFISRCIEAEVDSGMEQDEAAGMCYDIWENEKKSVFKDGLPLDLPGHLKK